MSIKAVEIISDFLKDTAKIIFGSMVIGFFLEKYSVLIFISGLLTTVTFLTLAILLVRLLEKRNI